jgi:hypothetical protein
MRLIVMTSLAARAGFWAFQISPHTKEVVHHCLRLFVMAHCLCQVLWQQNANIWGCWYINLPLRSVLNQLCWVHFNTTSLQQIVKLFANKSFGYGSAALVGLAILVVELSSSHSGTPHAVGLLWTSDWSVAETSTWQHNTHKRDIHAPGGIRTRNPSHLAAIDPRRRPHGHWNRR